MHEGLGMSTDHEHEERGRKDSFYCLSKLGD